jgi:hypothetical protein
VEIRIPLPRITPGLVSNLLGLAGIIGVLVAVAALTDWRWSLLLGSLVSVGMAYVAHLNGARTATVTQLDDARKVRAA